MTAATTRRPRESRGTAHRGPLPRGAARAGLPRRRRARAGPGRAHHRVGGRDLRRPLLHHLVDGRRRAGPPRLQGRARHRRGLPRHRLPLRRDHRHPRRRRGHAAGQPAHDHARADRRRAGRGVRQGPLQDRPRPVLRAAQGRAAGRRRWPTYDAWATGLRRAETHNRVIAPVIGWDAKKGKVKVSPLARWTDEQVERYIADNGVLVNPLVYDGYPSIGCWPCTRRVAPGDDPRSGRWAGTNKTECGIHHEPASTGRQRVDAHPAREEAPDGCSGTGGPGPRKPRPALRRDDHRAGRRGQARCAPTSRSSARSSSCPSRPSRRSSTGWSEGPRRDRRRPAAAHRGLPRQGRRAPRRRRGDRAAPGPADPDHRDPRPRGRASSRCSTCGCARRSRSPGSASSTRWCWPRPAPATRSPTRPSPGWPGSGAPATSCPVTAAFASAAPPATGEAVRAFRGEGRRHIAVASLFLAPGFLPDRAAELALEAGAVAVSEPLGAHPELARTILARYAVGAVELVPGLSVVLGSTGA